MVALFITHNYEDRYNIGNHHFKLELASRFDSHFFGPGYNGYSKKTSLATLLKKYNPDVLFLMFPTKDIERDNHLALFNYAKFEGTKIMYDTDAQSSVWLRCDFINRNKIDYLFLGNNFQINKAHKELISTPCEVNWLPFGVNTDYFVDKGKERVGDLIFLGCTNEIHYSNRIHMVAIVKRVFGHRFFFKPANDINRKKYVDVLNKHKIFVSAGDNEKGFFMKYLESMACGCLLISQYTPCFDRLGFIPGVHLGVYKNFNTCLDLCKYYLEYGQERAETARAGRQFVLKNHTWVQRADELIEKVLWKD